MTRKSFLARLRRLGACEEGYRWARESGVASPEEAWQKLDNPDWMAWLAIEFDAVDENALAETHDWCLDCLRVGIVHGRGDDGRAQPTPDELRAAITPEWS